MTYTISSTRPIPSYTKLYFNGPKKVEPSSRERLPLTRLKVGESFFAPEYENTRSMGGNIYNQSRRGNMRFSAQTSPNGGVTVWRVK